MAGWSSRDDSDEMRIQDVDNGFIVRFGAKVLVFTSRADLLNFIGEVAEEKVPFHA